MRSTWGAGELKSGTLTAFLIGSFLVSSVRNVPFWNERMAFTQASLVL